MQPEQLQEHIRLIHSWLRGGLGVLAFLFPVLLVGIGYFVEGIPPKDQLSAYYFAFNPSSLRQFPLRGLFIGILWAIGCFLILYRGFSKTENRLLNVAGFCALAVAIFPMYVKESCTIINATGGTLILQTGTTICGTDALSVFHKWAAYILFICMALVAWACSGETLGVLKAMNEQKAPEVVRWWEKEDNFRTAYNWIAFLMIAAPVMAFILYEFNIYDQWMLFVEWVGIWAFSFYWLLKSYELSLSDADKKAMKGEMKTPDKAPAQITEVPQPVQTISERARMFPEDLRKKVSRLLD
jgi:hypothetical protein